MIMDRGYDSDGLRRQLRRLASNRSSRIVKVGANRRCKTVGLAALQKALDRRAHVRLLGNFRRLTVRYDRSLTVYRGFFHIACFMITLRRVFEIASSTVAIHRIPARISIMS